MIERKVSTPDAMQPPDPCPACGHGERLFTPNARRDPYDEASPYEPAWQCTQCGGLTFVAVEPVTPATTIASFLQPVQIDDAGCLWLAPACEDWGPIVREHRLTAVIDLEEGLDHGIPAHPDRVIYVYFPIEDDDLPSRHKLHAVAHLGAALIREGERVLVHCEMGLNRSALLAGLMLVHLGTTGAEAVARLQARRPGALYNRRFAEYLAAQPAGGNEDAAFGKSEVRR
jgi:protein-tyrosine phosphatase